jgi:glutathione peroxidase
MNILKFLAFILIIFNFNFMAMANMTNQNSYQFSFTDINNKKFYLGDFAGKILLIVNTASKCGFTGQYQGLQELYEKYQQRGLVVIAVPSQDFARQEFAKEEQIKKFTQENFKISFPVTSLSKVKGADAHPFYIWAKKQLGFMSAPKWNFHKYLIDKEGDLVAWYASTTKPQAKKIINKIEELLAEN